MVEYTRRLGIILVLWLVACQPASSDPSTRLTDTNRPAIAPTRSADTVTPSMTPDASEEAYPDSTAAIWANGYLWTANASGLLTRWDASGGSYRQYWLPDGAVISTMAHNGSLLYAGTRVGDIWQLEMNGAPRRLVAGEPGGIVAITVEASDCVWYVAADAQGRQAAREGCGSRLARRCPGGALASFALPKKFTDNPDSCVTTLRYDTLRRMLWVGSCGAGVWRYNAGQAAWQQLSSVPGQPIGECVYDLALAADGTLWLAGDAGLMVRFGDTWNRLGDARNGTAGSVRSLAITRDRTVWATGEATILHASQHQILEHYALADNPLFWDRTQHVVADDYDRVWFVGRRGKLVFDGQSWLAFDADVRRTVRFTPATPPPPASLPEVGWPAPGEDYVGWLRSWPRPTADNGRGMHFLRTHQFDAIEAQRQVNRLVELGVRWALVLYADHAQLVRTAPIFQAAGITVVWRPSVRPYETYVSWADDVHFLRQRSMAPYIQIYNEPELAQEWDGRPPDFEVYRNHLLSAVQEVYAAGGYVGLQTNDPAWLRRTLRAIVQAGLERVFARLFFVPHMYGLNHSPDYAEDIHGVLGFIELARVFSEELGYVPVMIGGEGGWRPGEAQDTRFPAINEELHRDYHLAVFEWFRSRQLSNGAPLPDYLFAFCPWLISDAHDPAAWFDSSAGERSLTIEAVRSLPVFERKFSWDDR